MVDSKHHGSFSGESFARAAVNELSSLEKGIRQINNKNSRFLDRLRLVNNTLDVYFSNLGNKRIHEKLSVNILTQLNELKHSVGHTAVAERVSATRYNDKDIIKNARAIEDFIKKIDTSETENSGKIDASVREAELSVKNSPFKFYITENGFDRKDVVDEIDKALFSILFSQMSQVLSELKNEIGFYHNYFPETAKLIKKYAFEISISPNLNVISLWTIGVKLQISFEAEYIGFKKDNIENVVLEATFTAFNGLNGGIINCFEQGKNILRAADSFKNLDRAIILSELNSITEMIGKILKSPDGLVTEKVLREVGELQSARNENVSKIGGFVFGREYIISFVATMGLFVMKNSVGGSIGNAVYDGIKLIDLSVDFIRQSKDILGIIFADLPNSTGWIKSLIETYGPQVGLSFEKENKDIDDPKALLK